MWVWLAKLTVCHEFIISRFISLHYTVSHVKEKEIRGKIQVEENYIILKIYADSRNSKNE